MPQDSPESRREAVTPEHARKVMGSFFALLAAAHVDTLRASDRGWNSPFKLLKRTLRSVPHKPCFDVFVPARLAAGWLVRHRHLTPPLNGRRFDWIGSAWGKRCRISPSKLPSRS